MNYLCVCAITGDFAGIKTFLEQGIDINSVDDEGDTAIIVAAFMQIIEIMQYLIEHDARLDIRNHEGDTALIKAMRYIDLPDKKTNKIEIIRLLKEHGASLDITHSIDKKVLADFKNNVSAEEFKDCFPEFCRTPSEMKTASWGSSFAKQFPFLQSWFTFVSPPTAQELQTIRTGHHVHDNKQIKMD